VPELVIDDYVFMLVVYTASRYGEFIAALQF